MSRHSRRALLAAAGSALFAGCGSLLDSRPDDETVTPHDVPTPTARVTPADPVPPMDGPDPLGTAAVPATADSLEPTREVVSESAAQQLAVGTVARGTDRQVLLLTLADGSYGTPVLVTVDPSGDRTSQHSLAGLPSNEVGLFEQVDDLAVVGGRTETETDGGDTYHAWLRGFRDDEVVFEYDAPRETELLFSDIAAVDDGMLVSGHMGADHESESGYLARLRLDGTVAWERTIGTTRTATDFWAVTPTTDGILVGGNDDSSIALASFGRDGTDRWFRSVTRSDETYTVRDVAAGPTGRYALAQTNQFAQGNNHLLLLSLGEDGSIAWARRFDPNGGRQRRGIPSELTAAGVLDMDGPLVVGRTRERAWFADLGPTGDVQRADYHRVEDRPTRPVGLTRTDEGALVYGSVGRPNAEAGMDPWLAWL